MKSLQFSLLVLFTWTIPCTMSSQCVSLNVDYSSTWESYTEIVSQSGNNYMIEYTICNPTPDNWPLAIVDILLDAPITAVSPNPIVTPFGDFDMYSGGWDSGLAINSGACTTFTYEVSGAGPFEPEDIRIEVFAFNSTFSTTYCGTSLLHVCQSALVLSGVQNTVQYSESSDWIESTQTISGAIVVEHDAANFILLQPDFEVQLGAVYHAYIDGCGGN